MDLYILLFITKVTYSLVFFYRVSLSSLSPDLVNLYTLGAPQEHDPLCLIINLPDQGNDKYPTFIF